MPRQNLLNLWSGPVTTLTAIIGGVAWLTTLHVTTKHTKDNLEALEANVLRRLEEMDERDDRINGRLSRLEGRHYRQHDEVER